jgi:hypothetical protein
MRAKERRYRLCSSKRPKKSRRNSKRRLSRNTRKRKESRS